MSQLSEMIKELCPDGVEYRKLGEIAEIIRGNGLQKKDFVDSGVGCIHYGQIYTKYGAFADETLTYVSPELAATLKKVSTGDLVVAITSENVEDVCKCVAWLGNDDIVTGGHAAIVKHEQNPKYLSYIFQTEEFFRQKRKYVIGTKVIEMSPKKLAEIVIPVPPLPIQNEIVKMLDNFTELTAELTAELMLRKKQYEYYRASLLSFEKEQVERVKIESICLIQRGRVMSKGDIAENKGDYPVYSSQTENNGELGRISSFDFEGEYLTWTTDGANAGTVFYRDGKFSITNVCGLLKVKPDTLLTKYLYYALSIETPKYVNSGMGNPKLMSNVMACVKIPLPLLERQKEIVSILDRFDTLCNDLTQGLPAEIAARKKQYEYYRDKLLTFRRKGA